MQFTLTVSSRGGGRWGYCVIIITKWSYRSYTRSRWTPQSVAYDVLSTLGPVIGSCLLPYSVILVWQNGLYDTKQLRKRPYAFPWGKHLRCACLRWSFTIRKYVILQLSGEDLVLNPSFSNWPSHLSLPTERYKLLHKLRHQHQGAGEIGVATRRGKAIEGGNCPTADRWNTFSGPQPSADISIKDTTTGQTVWSLPGRRLSSKNVTDCDDPFLIIHYDMTTHILFMLMRT